MCLCCFAYSQKKPFGELSSLPDFQKNKIRSGLLVDKAIQKRDLLKSGSLAPNMATVTVIIYFDGYPDNNQLKELEKLGIEIFKDTWTPPVGNHPLGFMVARLPASNLEAALELPFVKQMDSAERRNQAMNNNAVRSVKANLIWETGFRGDGVKIGILDSGIDTSYAGTDLPENFEYKDYSAFPALDNDVANKITGHGTHVAATALGRGVLSAGKSDDYNGPGTFAGIAPGASLSFLKIGNDSTASANDAQIIAAIDAAVNIYHVNVLSMSYGGWDAHHDGTSALEQKVDWAYDQGVPFFLSAGNEANGKKHWKGTVGANAESNFIEIAVSNAGTNDTKLRFNLVWSDGANRNNLSLRYYDNAKNPIADVVFLPTTESPKGTESQYSYTNFYTPGGNSTYYLKIINSSGQAQECHIYDDWSNLEEGNSNVSFTEADPSYTIGSPASADFGFAVGAYVSRDISYDYQGNYWTNTGYVNDSLALFSSQGPRMDGLIKPDITAPGSMLLSLRDKDVYTTPNRFWVDNDGILGEGEANYYRMHGTSMACPVAAGCAALYLQQKSDATPREIYDAFKNFANNNGLTDLPNNKWGAGKLNIANVFNLVELLSPPDEFQGISPYPTLFWARKTDALSYNVQVSETENFSSIVRNITGVDTTHVVVEDLKFNTTYYWRVQSVGTTGSSGWSAPWSFTTGSAPSEAGYALWFDGQNDYVAVPHSPALDAIENYDVITAEAWVYINKWSADLFPILESYKPSIDWGWSFQLHNSSGLELGLIWSSVNQSTIPTIKSWNHVAVTYKKSEGKARFYLNGNFIGDKDFSSDIPDMGTDNPLFIGFNASGGDEYSSGIIDELRLWKVVRTAKQIKDNMYKSLTGTETNLAALYSFDEGKNFTANDRSEYHIHGVLTNGPIWVVSTNPFPCSAPVVGAITQPTCSVATGSVVLSGLPSSGTWNLSRSPGGATLTGSGSTATVSGLNPGTYTYTVTNNTGCVSAPTANIVINAQPQIPAAPTIGVITQPSCIDSTGSVILNGLPTSGTWSLTRLPGGATITGTGTSIPLSGLNPGTYAFWVENASGCLSDTSMNVVINSPPVTPNVASQSVSIQSGGTFTVNPAGVPSGTTYIWGVPVYTGGVTGGSAQKNPQPNISGTLTIPSGTGTATYIVTPTSGTCVGDTFLVTVTVSFVDNTAPTAISKSPTGILPNNDTTFELVLTMSENVVAGSGSLIVYKGQAVFSTFNISNVTISGNQVKVPVSLDKNTDYWVYVSPGFVKDAAGNPFAGITQSTDWTFRTKNFATEIVDWEGRQIIVYPNPTTGKITLSGLLESSRLNISVLDVSGRILKKKIVTSVDPILNISDVVPGIYLLILEGQRNQAIKIIKE
jgi:hypothetical protein